ncbi:hypothetical protein SGLAM104S_04370 [Streptomyces glaucescens]
MRKGVKGARGAVFTVMVGGAGYGAFNIVSALDGDGGGSGGAGAERTGPPSGDEVAETTRKFFAAWSGPGPGRRLVHQQRPGRRGRC